jgi:hypothetical protein
MFEESIASSAGEIAVVSVVACPPPMGVRRMAPLALFVGFAVMPQ